MPSMFESLESPSMSIEPYSIIPAQVGAINNRHGAHWIYSLYSDVDMFANIL